MVVSLSVNASIASYEQEFKTLKSGKIFVRIKNNTRSSTYCIISGKNYIRDFHVAAGGLSYWYPKPKDKNYKVECE